MQSSCEQYVKMRNVHQTLQAARYLCPHEVSMAQHPSEYAVIMFNHAASVVDVFSELGQCDCR